MKAPTGHHARRHLWIDDAAANGQACEKALGKLEAEWGHTDDDWEPVASNKEGWLASQSVYCLLSPAGAIDIFRAVSSMDDWQAFLAAVAFADAQQPVPRNSKQRCLELQRKLLAQRGELSQDEL